MKIDTSRFEAPTMAVLRIVAGAMFMCHGLQKIFWLLGATGQPPVGSQLWVGGIIELGCGALIALGLFTRAAAFLAAGTMAVAYFQFHWKLQTDHLKWLPIVNKGELSVLYCFVFLMLAARGSGVASVDHARRRRFGR